MKFNHSFLLYLFAAASASYGPFYADAFLSIVSAIKLSVQKRLCGSAITLCSSRSDLRQFDFSSRIGWDSFYRVYKGDSSYDEYEWHASLPNDKIIDRVPENAKAALVVGCGNSRLPRELYDRRVALGKGMTVACLDYSKPCIDQLRARHGSECPNMTFVHGDATRLAEALRMVSWDTREHKFDVILDKGLIDALMCGEGWDADVERVMNGVSDVLADNGMYILVSYKLAPSVKMFLSEMTGSNIKWEFDLPSLSNPSVSFSIGRRQ